MSKVEELLHEKKNFFQNFLRKKQNPNVHPLDQANMQQTILETSFQIQNILKITGKFQIGNKYDAYAFAGVGGSAAPAELFIDYLKSYGFDKPVSVVREYTLPPLPKKSIVFVMSYSGNTEEPISMLRDARRNNHEVVILASGGKLAETARIHTLPHVLLPQGLQPRQAIPYFFFTLLRIFESAKLIPDQTTYVDETIKALKKTTYREMAEELANQLVDKVPIVYATQRYQGVARKWKINFNETAKTPAFFNVFPELNHNEMISFTSKTAPFHFILLRDEDEHQRNMKRFAITKKLLKREGYPVTEIVIKGTNYLTKLFCGLHIGDWVAYTLALKTGKDPTPVELVEEFKQLMNE